MEAIIGQYVAGKGHRWGHSMGHGGATGDGSYWQCLGTCQKKMKTLKPFGIMLGVLGWDRLHTDIFGAGTSTEEQQSQKYS